MIYLGIDSGTQSTKVIALDDETGRILTQSQQAYELIPDLPAGHMEQHPESWWQATGDCLDQVCQALGDRRGEVRGIGVSGQQHGLVVLDRDDRPVRPAKLWCDTSTTDQCRQYHEAFGGPGGLIELAGNAMLPGYTAPKLLWLKQNEPENFARVRSVLLPHDYLNFRLTGVRRMEYGDASGTGWLNVRTRDWATELLDFIDPEAAGWLPPLGSSLQPHGELDPGLCRRWGLSDGVIVSAGGGDNMMGAIGTGNIRPGVVTVSLGTSGTVYALAEQPVADPAGEVAAFCDSTDRWLPLVCTMNVTVVTEQVRRLFGWDLAELERQVASVPPGAGGITMLPYLTGERTPNLPNASGVLHGLRPDNLSPAHLARAAAEGATLGLAYGLGRFRELGIDPSEIRLTGGGSNSATWRQLVADAFDCEAVTLDTAEGACLGAALQAAAIDPQGSGEALEDRCARLVQLDESTRCRPQAEARDLYRERLERHTGLSRCLSGGDWL